MVYIVCLFILIHLFPVAVHIFIKKELARYVYIAVSYGCYLTLV